MKQPTKRQVKETLGRTWHKLFNYCSLAPNSADRDNALAKLAAITMTIDYINGVRSAEDFEATLTKKLRSIETLRREETC